MDKFMSGVNTHSTIMLFYFLVPAVFTVDWFLGGDMPKDWSSDESCWDTSECEEMHECSSSDEDCSDDDTNSEEISESDDEAEECDEDEDECWTKEMCGEWKDKSHWEKVSDKSEWDNSKSAWEQEKEEWEEMCMDGDWGWKKDKKDHENKRQLYLAISKWSFYAVNWTVILMYKSDLKAWMGKTTPVESDLTDDMNDATDFQPERRESRDGELVDMNDPDSDFTF